MKFVDVVTVTDLRNYLLENSSVKSLFFHTSPQSNNGLEYVQVIRCKECKHYVRYDVCPDAYYMGCNLGYGGQDTYSVRDDDFCSWAERREDGNNDRN